MNAKQGFSWKSIENKPENWEKLHDLITSVYVEKKSEKDKYWNQIDLILDCLIQVYPDVQTYFEKVVNNVQGKKNKKKQTVSKKYEIMEKVEKDIIKKDLSNIRFDNKIRPLTIHFNIELNFVLMIFVWNFYVSESSRVEPIVFLDAIISFNRILDSEKENLIQSDRLWNGLISLRNKVNEMVKEDHYKLLFDNPIFLIESMADKRKKSIQLYPEQMTIINNITNAVMLDEPILMGNQMPTGTGKSFLAVPLAQKMNRLKRNKTILFACSNELVNQDIASTALLGDDIHLWLSKLIRDEHNQVNILLRPYKRCFPTTWKKVYKEVDELKEGTIVQQWNFYVEKTEKVPDIIVADLEACLELLKSAPLLDDPFIAYIDEFISDTSSNELMAQICKYLPKQTVLLSAILPSFSNIQPIIDHFCLAHHCHAQDVLKRVETHNVPITCAIIDQEGCLRMPHHQVTDPESLNDLLLEIEINPRIRRCYTAKHVYHWSKDLESVLDPLKKTFQDRFPDIGKIKNTMIIDYAIELLKICEEHFEHLERFQSYRPKIFEKPDASKIFTEQAFCYEGKTLFISNDTFQHLFNATSELFQDCVKWSILMNETQKLQTAKEASIQKLEKMDVKKNNKTFNRLEKDRMISEIQEKSSVMLLPSPFVINSKEHFMRYHHDTKLPHHFLIRHANFLPDEFNDAFLDHENLCFASGIGFYDKIKMTTYQRNLMMSIYRQLFFICSCKDIVFGTNLPDLVNVFITREFAEKENIPILYQLMGRVGRMGRSYHANIILDSETSVQKILSLDKNVDNVDVKQMLLSF